MSNGAMRCGNCGTRPPMSGQAWCFECARGRGQPAMESHSFVARSGQQTLGRRGLEIAIDSIDWNRALIAGAGIHLSKGQAHAYPPAGSGIMPLFHDNICGECLREAILRGE